MNEAIRTFEKQDRAASYERWCVGGRYVHQWGFGPSARFAVGCGPLEDVTRADAEAIVGRPLP